MRTFCSLVIWVLCCTLQATDRLFQVPTGTKIRQSHVRLEMARYNQNPERWQGFLGFGISHSFDGEILFERVGNRSRPLSFNFAYNYVLPVVDITPGISVGVRDALGKTLDGKSFYLAATFRLGQEGFYNYDTPAEFTLGVGSHSINGAFVSFMLPFADSFRLLGEHDGKRVTAGVELRPFRASSLRVLFRENQSLLSLSVSHRF